MKEIILELNWLEIAFFALAVVSLVFNILQWQDRKASKEPLSNALTSIFNDIKAKTNNAYFMYNALFNPKSPHKDIETLKWEYGLYIQSVISQLLGFQEQLVGVLVSLNPGDKTGKRAFRALEYGLTEREKDFRDKHMAKVMSPDLK